MEDVAGAIGVDRFDGKCWHVADTGVVQPEEAMLSIRYGNHTPAHSSRVTEPSFDIIALGKPAKAGGGKDDVIGKMQELVNSIHVADIGIENTDDVALACSLEYGGRAFPPAIIGKDAGHAIKLFQRQPFRLIAKVPPMKPNAMRSPSGDTRIVPIGLTPPSTRRTELVSTPTAPRRARI